MYEITKRNHFQSYILSIRYIILVMQQGKFIAIGLLMF